MFGIAQDTYLSEPAQQAGRAKARHLHRSEKKQVRNTVKKWVYFFGAGKAEGNGEWRDLLGGKGAGLAEMTRIGLPVPAGFTISTEACDDFYKNGKKFNNEVKKQVADNVAKLEKVTRKKLGDPKNPLLVSVRSGSARSMPGMMETILNLGLNDKSVEGLAAVTKNDRFAYDAYRRFVQMYSTVVMGMSKEDLEHRLRALKTKLGVKEDTAVPASGWKELVKEYKAYLQGASREAVSRRSHGAVVGSDRRGIRFVDGREGYHLSPRREDHRAAWHRRQRAADGVRQHRRQFRHGRLLHARPELWRKDFLWRLSDQRAGRRCGGRHPHAGTSQRTEKDYAEGVRAARKGSYQAGEALPRYAGHGVHRRRRQALHAADAHRKAYPGSHV